MPRYSLVVKLQNPLPLLAQRMRDSVLAQSLADWELVLVVPSQAPTDIQAAHSLAGNHAVIRVIHQPENQSWAQACNAMLPILGDWVGFLGQHDQLIPAALETLHSATVGRPTVHVVYSDEECLDSWGQTSCQIHKGALDPIRLLSQEYLQNLALIRRTWLESVGGFDLLASDVPTHDLFLRLLEQSGTADFAYVPAVVYRKHRNRLQEPEKDHRLRPYLPRYDLDAVRRHFERTGIAARVQQWNGTLSLDFPLETLPAVTILVVLGDDVVFTKAQLASLGTYPHATVQAVFHGKSQQAFLRSQEICAGLRIPLQRLDTNLPTALNQLMPAIDTPLVALVQGMPLGVFWLRRLVALLQLPSVAAAGPNVVTPVQQVTGAAWDSRGAFNRQAVPHTVDTLSAQCILFNVRQLLELGGFADELPTLFVQDFSLRLQGIGQHCVATPRVHVQTSTDSLSEPGESSLFRSIWPD